MLRWFVRGIGGCVVAVGVAVIVAQAPSGSAVRELPPNAKPGECYAKVAVPPAYKTETVQVTQREASEKIEIIPARYEWVEQQVMLKEGRDKLEIVPAEYKWVEEKVQVSPAVTKTEQVEARYAWVAEKVMIKPAQSVWKKGSGPIQKVDHGTGEIMCMVEEPAIYETVKKRVQKTPASTNKIEIPAKFQTVKKQVLAKPETTRKVPVSPKYTTIKVKKLVSPAQEKRVPIPATLGSVEKKVKVSDGRLEWQPVLCQTNMNRDLVTSIQRALKGKGIDPGPIDGLIGSQTMQAVYDFQRKNNLPRGALTVETLRALDVRVN